MAGCCSGIHCLGGFSIDKTFFYFYFSSKEKCEWIGVPLGQTFTVDSIEVKQEVP